MLPLAGFETWSGIDFIAFRRLKSNFGWFFEDHESSVPVYLDILLFITRWHAATRWIRNLIRNWFYSLPKAKIQFRMIFWGSSDSSLPVCLKSVFFVTQWHATRRWIRNLVRNWFYSLPKAKIQFRMIFWGSSDSSVPVCLKSVFFVT